jgi:antitoxin ParD1/3/4
MGIASLRHDQTRRAEQKLEALLMEGLDSGAPLGISTEYWKMKRHII